MANQQSSVRFDHREIAVIFSLFVFVSLLMFTVGILVGKGLSQANSGGKGAMFSQAPAANHHEVAANEEHGAGDAHAPAKHAEADHSTGTSVSTDHPTAGHEAAEHGAVAANEHGEESHAPPTGHEAQKEDAHGGHGATAEAPHGGHGANREVAEAHPAEKSNEPLKLVPEKPRTGDVRAGLQEYPKTKEVEAALKNPKLQSLYEGGPAASHGHAEGRATASVPAAGGKAPTSFAQGQYTVQVGSYPSEKEAGERIEALKKLGFTHAFLSAIKLGGKDTWYRVWLGYFPDAASARQSGEYLQARSEVKTYFVRRSDNKD